MSATLLWIVLAVGLFWMVGLYNRLVRMRGYAVQTLGSVEQQLRWCARVVDVHLAAMGRGKRCSTQGAQWVQSNRGRLQRGDCPVSGPRTCGCDALRTHGSAVRATV